MQPACVLPFSVVPMSTEHAALICKWHYEPPYNIYGWLPWEQMQQLEIEFGDPQLREQQYVVILDRTGELCGFAQFFPLEGTIRLGIGMRPDLCGHGYGEPFMRAITAAAISRNPEAEIDLEVLTWNQRAIRTYEKAGFHITDTYSRRTPDGMKPFYCMVYDETNEHTS
ncbi:GNAT family N-acetyltransferase [Paenibacillus sp. SGZ-1009]|uniref:GNAT family N-acetyltransferase n=1 Tax=Paenibacillus campi TaxID=3106031 RepID=UPI002AFDD322|nr:GNAT family N-acetyltransferase [Paenibacillus sp. SGZ-1009]